MDGLSSLSNVTSSAGYTSISASKAEVAEESVSKKATAEVNVSKAQPKDDKTVQRASDIKVEKTTESRVQDVNDNSQQKTEKTSEELATSSQIAEVQTNEFGDTFEKSFAAEEKESDSSDKVTTLNSFINLSGYTDTQVEQMYRDGEISRAQYDRTMDERNEIKEERQKQLAKQTGQIEDFTVDTVQGQKKVAEQNAISETDNAENLKILSSVMNIEANINSKLGIA